jgi:hypothetical protein
MSAGEGNVCSVRNKGAALLAEGRQIMGVNSTVLEPKGLRPEII